ncbi:MAG: TonB-dependent receptor [Gammaproteobacteria bacterium]|nr:TonB-dependent receptor [Gammaproteobacteria bacterium]
MNNTLTRPAGRLSALALGVALASTPAAWAQQVQQQAQRTSLEEIVVTGTMREQRSQDVPIAITAMSEEQLQRTYRTDVLAVAEMAPGVSMGQQSGFRAVAGGIRGTGQNGILVTQDSSVVIVLDDFYLSNVQTQFVELFDIEQVEVYRGPQGTLFGKSATGGAIFIRTKRPEMDEFNADFEVQTGRFVGGSVDSDIFKFRSAINVPLIEDQLALRFTALYDYDEGFYRNNKDTATFPGSMPIYAELADALGTTTAELLPPELNTRARGSGEKLNNTDVWAGSVKLLWQPSDTYEAYFKYERSLDRSGTVPGVNETPEGEGFLLPLLGFPGIHEAGHGDVFSTGVTNQCIEGNPKGLCLSSGQRVEVEGFHLQQRLDLENYTVRLFSGYREQTEILPNTYVGEAFTSLFDAARNTTKDSLQFELRVNSDLEGPFNFVAGASYMEEDTDMLAYSTVGLSSLVTFLPSEDPDSANPLVADGTLDSRGFLNLNLDFINDPATTGARQDRETWAAYFDGTYEITEDLSFSAGIRYTRDKKEFYRRANPGGPCTALTPARNQVVVDGECLDSRSNAISRGGADFTMADVHPFNLPEGVGFEIDDTFNESWSEWTWRAVLDYRVSDELMTYLSYSTGFISGGFTETCSSLATCVPFDSETNWNLETGLKSDLMDGRLRLNAALYYTRYEDLIRSQVLPFTDAFGVTTQETINVNAGESEAYGLEVEALWMASENLSFELGAAWMRHKYKEFDLDTTGDGVTEDLSSLDVPYSPEWQVVAGVTYDQYLSSGRGSITYNTSFNYESSTETLVFNPSLSKMESRLLWDANITWRDESERYRVSLWAKNLLDEEYRIAANSVAGLWNFTMFGRPRSVGMEFAVRF